MNLHEVMLASQLMGGSNRKFRHIETVIVDTTGVSMVKRTQEPDGTPYDFRKVLVRLTVPKGNITSTGRINLNTTCTIAWRTDFISSSSEVITTVRAELDGGFINGFSLYTKTVSERIAPSTKSEVLFNQYDNIHTITVFTDPSSIHLPVGTKLEIYAVDM